MFKWLHSALSGASIKGFFKWGNLYSVGLSPLTSVAVYGTILVPTAALVVDVLSEVSFLGIRLFSDLTLPNTILLAYLFSLFFGLGAIVALALCPDILKRYRTVDDLVLQVSKVANGLGTKQDQALGGSFDINDTTPEIESVIAEAINDVGQKHYQTAVLSGLEQAQKNWEHSQISLPFVRYCVGAMFIASFVLGFILFFVVMPRALLAL